MVNPNIRKKNMAIYMFLCPVCKKEYPWFEEGVKKICYECKQKEKQKNGTEILQDG